MAFYTVNTFIYDSESNNIRVQLTRPVDVDYDYTEETGPPYEVIETQIYLDANTMKIGQYFPASVDGTIQQHFAGRDVGQGPDVVPPIPLPEEPTG